MKIIVAGGTGFIGSALVSRLLKDGHTVVLLTRNGKISSEQFPHKESPSLSIVQWDGKTDGAWSDSIDGADAVINFSGASIAGKRWTKPQKELLLSSRIDPTRAIVGAISKAKKKPGVFVNASAVGYYGNVPDGEVTEDSPSGSDYLSGLCRAWESEAREAEQSGVRVVMLRTGIVLGRSGGALKKMLLPFQLFAGGPIGTGKQWMPWIHLEDEIGVVLFVLQEQSISGPVNVTASNPVMMKEFATRLGHAIHRPSWASVPAFVLKIALGEMADMLLGGQKAVPKKLLSNGFKFQYGKLENALKVILQE